MRATNFVAIESLAAPRRIASLRGRQVHAVDLEQDAGPA